MTANQRNTKTTRLTHNAAESKLIKRNFLLEVTKEGEKKMEVK